MFENTSANEAAECLLVALRELAHERARTFLAAEVDRWLQPVYPRDLGCFNFGPRPAIVLPGDAIHMRVVYTTKAGAQRELRLIRREHPEPRVDALAMTEAGLVLLGALELERVYYSSRITATVGWGDDESVVSLGLEGAYVYVANLGHDAPVRVEPVGLERGAAPIAFQSLAEVALDATEAPASEAEERANGTAILRTFLAEISAMKIWDYMWLEAPPPEKFGKSAVLAFAASTDLMYYDILRIIFKGVRFNSTQNYFHHPFFRLAPAVPTRQLRDLASFGEKSKAICVHRDFGGHLAGVDFVVADFLFLQHGPFDRLYRPSRTAHVDWWRA